MSTGTGKAATGTEKKSENQLFALLGDWNQAAQGLKGQALPIVGELGNQIYEALKTGGVGAQIPQIGAAQQQSRQATSRALQGTTNQFAQMGLSRSPFAASALAGTRLAGEQATNMIPQQVASQFIGMAPGFAGGLLGTAFGSLGAQTSGLGQLAGFGAQRDIAKGQELASMYQSIGESAQKAGSSALSSGAGMAMMCWIAFAIYGDRSLSARYARHYIANVWQGRRATLGRKVYRAVGPFLAARIRCHPWLGSLLRPLFDIAVRRGRQALDG